MIKKLTRTIARDFLVRMLQDIRFIVYMNERKVVDTPVYYCWLCTTTKGGTFLETNFNGKISFKIAFGREVRKLLNEP